MSLAGFLNSKSKQNIPQTTRNSQRKILLDYGNSNFILDKEIKLKSRRNSKKHGGSNANILTQRSQSKGTKKPINFTKTLIYSKKNCIQKSKRSPCRSERKMIKNKEIKLNERFPFLLPDELSPENIDVNGLHTELNKTHQKRAVNSNEDSNNKSEFRRYLWNYKTIELSGTEFVSMKTHFLKDIRKEQSLLVSLKTLFIEHTMQEVIHKRIRIQAPKQLKLKLQIMTQILLKQLLQELLVEYHQIFQGRLIQILQQWKRLRKS